MRARFTLPSLVLLALPTLTPCQVEAQTPSPTGTSPSAARRPPQPHNVTTVNHSSSTPNYHYSFYPPIPVDPSEPNYYEPAHKSVVRHNPLPRSDQSWGVRNPGGVGRMAEYYPPGNRFQNENAQVPVARFDQGGGPNRAEQQASQSLGIQRANSIQGNINNYARMNYGFGIGGGGVYGFPN